MRIHAPRIIGGAAAALVITASFAVVPAASAVEEEVVSETPANLMQAVGVPESGMCSDVDDSLLEWGSDIHGGWSKSWMQWVDDEKGGEACYRELAYSDNDGAWYAVEPVAAE